MFILISLPLYSDYVQTNIQFSSSRRYKRPVYSAARAVLSACHLFFGPQKTLAQDTGTLTDNIGKVCRIMLGSQTNKGVEKKKTDLCLCFEWLVNTQQSCLSSLIPKKSRNQYIKFILLMAELKNYPTYERIKIDQKFKSILGIS